MRIVALVSSFVALVAPSLTPEILIDEDLAKELKRNEQLREASPEHLTRFRDDLRRGTVKRAALLRGKTMKSATLMLSAALAGWLAAGLGPTITGHASAYALLSAFVFAWGTVGRLGWEGQTIRGTTSIELLDSFLLRSLYWLGMFFATLALL